MSNIQDNVTPLTTGAARANVASAASAEASMDRLLVLGSINPNTDETHLLPLFVIPGAADIVLREPGDYAIVLRNSSGELARYAFTPEELHSGPDNPNGPSAPPVQALIISEFVPYVVGTTRVDIEGPSGLLATVSAGASAPQVTVVSPNGGEYISGDTVSISWTASDQDGDGLVFNVEFSRDNGLTWELLAQHVTGTSVEIPREYIASTSQGLIRVWVSDGIHTTSDTSDATFTTATRDPEIQILSPAPETYLAANQTLSLVALAYSINVGTPQPEQVTWTSSVDGTLGNGEELSVTGLTPGVHDITVTFDDGVASSSATVHDIVVVADPRTLPVPSDKLAVGPKTLVFWPEEGISEQTVSVGNLAGSDSLSFGSLEFTSWLSVSPTTGNTPGEVTVSVDAANLDPGMHDARIAFASAQTTGSTFIDVIVTIPERGFRVMLPLVLR